MAKDLNAIFQSIDRHSTLIAHAAMRSAAQKAFALAKEKAQSCLKNYYKRKPKIYKRTYTLQNAIVYRPPTEKKHRGDNYSISFAVVYDSSKLQGKYKSRSWWHQSGDKWKSRFDGGFNQNRQNNGVPEAGWILKNYLLGIHPGWTYNELGSHPGWIHNEWRGWIDDESTEDAMEDYFINELPQIVHGLIYESMQSAIMNFLK